MIPSTLRRRLSSLRVELPLRGIAAALLLLSVKGWAQISGVTPAVPPNIYFIDGSGSGTGTFATIQVAFTALQTNGLDPVGTGAVLRVQSTWDPNAEPNTIALSTYANAGPNRPVLLTFADLLSPVTLTKSPTATAGNRFIFRFTGNISYFTLDGANKLILKSTATGGTTTGLIGFVSTTSLALNIDAIAIQNVVMHGRDRSNTFSGIYIGQDATLTTGTVSTGSNIGAVRGVTFQGCTIDSVSRPILIAGVRTNTRNIRILADTLGNPNDPTAWAAASNIGAIHLRGVVNPTVRGCVVHGEDNASNYGVSGIRIDTCENFTVERNWIYNIRYTGTGGWGNQGIFITMPAAFIGPAVNIVSNNMIAGISADGWGTSGLYWVSGIFVQGNSSLADNALSIVHNSINLYGSYTGTSTSQGSSAGIVSHSTISGGVTIHGNLIQNTFDAANNDTAYCIVIRTTAPSSAGFNVNYNQYYLASPAPTNRFGAWGSTPVPNFAAWQALSFTPDANGMMHQPGPVPFVSNIDLHLVSNSPSTAINAGNAALYNGTLDFDGQIRSLPSGASANTPPDPGTAPDIGADELDGTPFSCPSSLQAPNIVVTTTYPPLAAPNYLWGQQVEIDTTGTNSPTPSGSLNIIYSLDGGATWTAGPAVTAFPVTITLPPVTPPYTATMLIAVTATAPSFCSLTPDTSNTPASIGITDRSGNRAATAISITLTPDPLNPGQWIAPVISDSTDGLGVSNEYTDPTLAPVGGTRGRPTRDLFFVINLPECLDSLDVSLCSSTAGLLSDTYLHLINATVQDTIDSDDGCNSTPKSEIRALGLPNTLGHNPLSNVSAVPARDTLLLVSGHTLYIVVEGYGSDGKFELRVKGYKGPRPSSISITGAPSAPVCVNSAPVTLNATPGADSYLWTVDGFPIPGNASSVTLPPAAEGTFSIQAVAVYNPNQDPTCPTAADSVASAPVTITVEDTARAQIADASNTIVSGQTLSITAGSNVTLNVSSTQTSGNTYTWKRYNSIPPSGTPTTSTGNSLTINSIAAGDYTVVLEAVRGTGACGMTRDTVYLSVTTSLRAEAGNLGIYPNPNTGSFTVVAPATGSYEVEVLDVAGRIVARDAFTGRTHQVKLSLSAGVYQLRLRQGEKLHMGRLIITE